LRFFLFERQLKKVVVFRMAPKLVAFKQSNTQNCVHMLASRSGLRGSRRKYQLKVLKGKGKVNMKFKMNDMNLIRYGESEGGAPPPLRASLIA
jgi:hypothetical protein